MQSISSLHGKKSIYMNESLHTSMNESVHHQEATRDAWSCRAAVPDKRVTAVRRAIPPAQRCVTWLVVVVLVLRLQCLVTTRGGQKRPYGTLLMPTLGRSCMLNTTIQPLLCMCVYTLPVQRGTPRVKMVNSAVKIRLMLEKY